MKQAPLGPRSSHAAALAPSRPWAGAWGTHAAVPPPLRSPTQGNALEDGQGTWGRGALAASKQASGRSTPAPVTPPGYRWRAGGPDRRNPLAPGHTEELRRVRAQTAAVPDPECGLGRGSLPSSREPSLLTRLWLVRFPCLSLHVGLIRPGHNFLMRQLPPPSDWEFLWGWGQGTKTLFGGGAQQRGGPRTCLGWVPGAPSG